MDPSFLRGLKFALKKPALTVKNTASEKHKHKSKAKLKKKIVGISRNVKAAGKKDALIADVQASMFRYLNEKLYKCSSDEAVKYFNEDPSAFKIYHEGFQNQLQKWPNDPLTWPEEIIRKDFKSKPVVADMGCGDARLALKLNKIANVHSFDLVAVNERVTVCDMAHTPLASSSVDVVIFCLALMGTNCRDFFYEANRILKPDGTLLIVEVASRFDKSFKKFLKLLKPFGFKITSWEITADTYFAHGRLSKVNDLSKVPVASLPEIVINPCLYKKRAMEAIIGHVREGNLAETRLWLDMSENDVNQGDEHRFSLLHWAAREGRRALVELLISRGARVNATNLGDDTALHLAAAHGHYDVVYFLLNNFRLAVDAPNEHGNTPLHYACFWNHHEIAELLIKFGASLMQENKYGYTPLEIARPRAAAMLAPMAQSYGADLTKRRPFRDQSWIGTKTRARDATIYKLDGDAWDPRDVELSGALADGHGAEVLRGFFRNKEVVVKMLKLRHYTDRQARDFKEEFPRLRIFNHPNILPVLAIFNATPRLCLVSEFMPFGSLYSLLHPSPQQQQQLDENGQPQAPPTISLRQALRFALDIAKAMEFLHSPELKVPNFRLNSRHVLVDEDVAKIGSPIDDDMPEDEMLTARLDMADYKFSFHEKAREYNPAWMSPEALQKKPQDINLQASDMWSFGVILWELITRMEPFEGLDPMVIGMQVAMESLRLPRLAYMDVRIVRLLDLCMNEDPGKRPRFDMLLPLLDKMRERAGHTTLASH